MLLLCSCAAQPLWTRPACMGLLERRPPALHRKATWRCRAGAPALSTRDSGPYARAPFRRASRSLRRARHLVASTAAKDERNELVFVDSSRLYSGSTLQAKFMYRMLALMDCAHHLKGRLPVVLVCSRSFSPSAHAAVHVAEVPGHRQRRRPQGDWLHLRFVLSRVPADEVGPH